MTIYTKRQRTSKDPSGASFGITDNMKSVDICFYYEDTSTSHIQFPIEEFKEMYKKVIGTFEELCS